jgi:hypothetical protein
MTRLVSADRLTPIDLPFERRRELAATITHSATTSWFGTPIEVRFALEEAAALHRRRYARLPSQLAGELRGFAVADGAETYFWIEDGPAFRWHDRLGAAQTQFLADVVVRTAYFMERCPYLSFHAAAIKVGESAAAITARSEGGKTTTALACVLRGMHLYSDERCIVDDGRVLPFPRAVNVRAGSLELLATGYRPGDPGLGGRLAARRGADWAGVDYADICGDATLPEPRPLRAVFFISGRGPAPSIVPMELNAAVGELLAAPLRGRARGAARVVEATALLRRAQPYALTLGTPAATAQAIEAICAGGARRCA